MIPNVCISWCQNKATCRWCEKPIEPGTAMVRVFFWRKGDPDSRRINIKQYYHPQCWVDQGLDYLKMNPYVPYKRGEKPHLPEKKRRQRYLLMRRYHRLQQRKRQLKTDYPDRVLVEARLDGQILDIVMDIAKVGGVPESWKKKLV